MIFHDIYTDVPRDEIDRFVATQVLGRLVTVGEDGTPHIGLYPFFRDGDVIEMHLVRRDEQAIDLKARPRCVFEVDEVLTVIPSYWVHPESAVSATAYHRTVIFETTAIVTEDADAIAAQQMRLMARHQPEGGFRHINPDDPLYKGAIATICAVTLKVTACRPKWKLAQNRPLDARRRIIEELRKRGLPGDARAADALQWTVDREPAKG
jgi:predicted FMN-binding regulatory protein PaiB